MFPLSPMAKLKILPRMLKTILSDLYFSDNKPYNDTRMVHFITKLISDTPASLSIVHLPDKGSYKKDQIWSKWRRCDIDAFKKVSIVAMPFDVALAKSFKEPGREKKKLAQRLAA